MCGIWALFGYESSDVKHYENAFKIAHRGPDCFQLQNASQLRNCTMAFYRLSIVDSVKGMQPMTLQQYPHLTLMCNGEIYNFRKLAAEFNFHLESDCDVEIILHLYEKFGAEKASSLLDGVFAFIVLDTRNRKLMLSRDTYGVRPLFYFFTKSRVLGACSEVKGLVEILNTKYDQRQLLKVFPPAHFQVYDIIDDGKLSFVTSKKFHGFADEPQHWKYQGIELLKGNDEATAMDNIRTLFTNAVEKRLMSYRRVGSLLSGGLDSSLVTAIIAKKLKEKGFELPLQTFSIGMDQSPDVLAARKMARKIGSEHHEVSVTPEQGINAIEEVIYAIETYDIITVRSSIPLYLLSKYINSNTDTVVVLTGEGSDELTQGYIYFHKQPSAKEGDEDSRRLLDNIHYFDVLRTDRATAAHGLEVRAPFLDHAFASYYLSLPAEMRCPRNGIEKYLLRACFADYDLIPDEILWRRKEGFSDGMASKKKSWYCYLKEHLESKITDEQFAKAATTFPHNTPNSKEAYYYRSVFENRFGSQLSKLVPYQWMPKWVECQDPSARVLDHYQNDEEE